MKCTNCGAEIPDSKFCPECGAKIESNDNESGIVACAQDLGKSAIDSWKDRNKATSKVSAVKIDENHRKFQINGTIPKNGKKSGIVGKSVKGIIAVSTLGLSLAVKSGQKVGTNKWFDFEQLLNYDLIEDDSTVTSGGVGMALVGGLVFGGAGMIAGGMTGKKKAKKKIESMLIRVTLNDFDSPCILIPIITKSTKIDSKEYQTALKEASNILSALDVITHNK